MSTFVDEQAIPNVIDVTYYFGFAVLILASSHCEFFNVLLAVSF